MKRQGQLLEKIADLHNLYEASYKAQKGKISKHDVYAYSRQLQLVLKPCCLNEASKGLPFLGYLLFSDRVRLASRSKKRFIKKSGLFATNLETERWSQKEYANHFLPLVAFTEHANAREFRKKISRKLLACEV